MILEGGAGNDTVYGEDGNNSLTGNEGNDVLDGGTGNDLLDGGVGGVDLLTGGAGADAFGATLAARLDVAGGDAAEVLEAADGGFDPPTLAAAAPVVTDRDGSIAAAENDRDCAAFAQAVAEPVDVVGAVGDQSAERTGSCDQVRAARTSV